MLSRRAWNSVQFDVDVSSRYLPCVGIHASQSNFRCAESPRSPAAVSMTRYASSSLSSHSFSQLSSASCSLVRVLEGRVDEHLDLVEPVHPEDAPGVLAVGACLLAVARAERDVTPRQRLDVEDLVGVVCRQRHLRRADEVEVLLRQPVDVIGRLTEEAGAFHRARLDQRRGDHRGESCVARLVHRHVDQRELEVRAGTGQVVEARPGHLGAALDVDGAEPPAQLDVVERLEALGREVARRADVLEHGVVVLAAGRGLRRREVRHQRHARREGLLGLALPGLGRLDLGGDSLVRASSAAFSSPAAWATCLPIAFCSARSRSNSVIADRRASSRARISSTSSGDAPRRLWASRASSGSSRSTRKSITRPGYPPGCLRLTPVSRSQHPRIPRPGR